MLLTIQSPMAMTSSSLPCMQKWLFDSTDSLLFLRLHKRASQRNKVNEAPSSYKYGTLYTIGSREQQLGQQSVLNTQDSLI